MDDFRIAMLASGSKGNSALICAGDKKFLIDLGLSCRELVKRLRQFGVAPDKLDGIFLTHEHIDHIRGLKTFLKKYPQPIYTSEKTWRAIFMKEKELDRQWCNSIEENISFDELCISAFPVPHDAVDTHGYIFTKKTTGTRCAYLTDCGFISPTVRAALVSAEYLILEANHDEKLLREGPYPDELKKRILSTRGHLSNAAAGNFLSELERLPKKIILAHLSEQNNTPTLASETIKKILGERAESTKIFVAKQNEAVAAYEYEQPKIF